MSYSDYQRNIIRAGLRQFYKTEEIHAVSGEYSWKDVREVIAEETGVEIASSAKNGAERLRQFVEGNPDPANPGKRKYPKKLDWLPVAAEFLMSKNYRILMPYDLDENRSESSPFLRLSEYLSDNSKLDDISLIPNSTFSTTIKIEWGYEITEFYFQKTGNPGLTEVVEIRDTFAKDEFEKGDTKSFEWRSDHVKGREKHGGFLVVTNEKTLIIFMKKGNGLGKYQYISVAANTDYLDGLELKELMLYRQEDIWPLYEEENNIRDVSSSYLENNILHFMRNFD